jgi:ABC-2 type transport system permease protein
MLGTFLKKQILLMVRNRQEIIVLLIMPFVLISILGFALGNLLNRGEIDLNAKLAVVHHGDEEEDLAKIKKETAEWQMPAEQQRAMEEALRAMAPLSLLKKEVFPPLESEGLLKVEYISGDEAEKRKKDFAAILEIPEHFTYDLLHYFLFEEGEKPKLSLTVREGNEISSQMIEDILLQVEKQYAIFRAIGKTGGEGAPLQLTDAPMEGSFETVSKSEPIDAFTYYTAGMGVMFALYIASYMASYALREKRSNVFHRIMLADVKRGAYLFGIFASGAMLAFIQIMILFGLSFFVYKVKWPDLSSFFLVSAFLSLAVGSISVLLTSVNYKLNSENASNLFSSIIVSIFAFLGGSYFPVSQISETLQNLGSYTPNGAAFSGYLKILQGYGISEISPSLLALGIFTAIIFCIGIFLFPGRRNEA